MTPVPRLEPGRTYRLAEAAALLQLSVVSLQARLRRAERRSGGEARTVELTPWLSAYRFCGGREWRFCARERAHGGDDDHD